FVCARCRDRLRDAEAAAGPGPAAGGGPEAVPATRSPALAALLSFFPGLGQGYAGDVPRGLLLFPLVTLLLYGAIPSAALPVFPGLVWFFQVFDAFHAASRPGGAASLVVPDTGGDEGPWLAWALIAAGLLLFLQNLQPGWLPALRYLVPGLVIVFGLVLV